MNPTTITVEVCAEGDDKVIDIKVETGDVQPVDALAAMIAVIAIDNARTTGHPADKIAAVILREALSAIHNNAPELTVPINPDA